MRIERQFKFWGRHFASASLCCLFWLLLALTAPQVYAEPRSLYIYGALPIEYSAELAQFGNPMGLSVSANLMLPPDNPWLCEYPESLQNLTAADIATMPQFQFNRDVALFVSINRCSAETKARVVAQLRERISNRIRMIILYSTNPQEFKFISLESDNGDNPPDLKDIGILYIPHRYASGIDLRMRMQYQNDDPRFSWETSERWNFPIEVTALSDRSRSRRSDASYNGGDIYWFRIILFSLLIASPCCRACYLWYAGGGRLHWRRNERGRIIGIQYIPPMPLWLTTGRPPHDGPAPVGVLTEEQFNSLPEIVYTGVPEKDGSDTDADEEDNDDGGQVAGNPHTWSNTEVKSGTEEITVEGSESAVVDVDLESGAPMASSQASNGSEAFEPQTMAAGTMTTGKLDVAEKLNENAAGQDSNVMDQFNTPNGLEEGKDGELSHDSDGKSGEKGTLQEDSDFLKSSSEPNESNEDAAHHEVNMMSGSLSQLPEEEIIFNGGSTDGSSPISSDTEGDQGEAESSNSEPQKEEECRKQSAEFISPEFVVNSNEELTTAKVPAQQVVQQGEQDNSPQPAPSPSVSFTPQEATSNEQQNSRTTEDSDDPAVESVEGETSEDSTGDKQTTSTACAICIDEFETGERLTLLPRCKHAFHRECIHAWLIERQGCCPLCKTDVLEPDPNNSPGELDLEAPAEQRFMISSM